MQKKFLIALWVLGGLFLLVNVGVYYYQRHTYIKIIEAWQKQDQDQGVNKARTIVIEGSQIPLPITERSWTNYTTPLPEPICKPLSGN